MLRNILGIGMLFNTPAFQKGKNAAEDGQPLSDNPYFKGSSLWSDWYLGWRVTSKMVDLEQARVAALKVDASSAFDMGREAATRAMSPTTNPFLPANPAHKEWRLGWAQAMRSR
ncbi:MAG: hypothetical protein AAFR68_11050 [Pseudomonadota bacterium]